MDTYKCQNCGHEHEFPRDEAVSSMAGSVDPKEFARLKERERKCPTMLESEARALVRALQEIRDELHMIECASPKQIVEAVLRLKSNSVLSGKYKRKEKAMSLKWSKVKYGSNIVAESYSIQKSNDGFSLYFSWNFVCMLQTEAGCKRVANCINREMVKDRINKKG